MAIGSIVPGVRLVAINVTLNAIELNPGRALEPSRQRVSLKIIEAHAKSHCRILCVDQRRLDITRSEKSIGCVRFVLWIVDHFIGLLDAKNCGKCHE